MAQSFTDLEEWMRDHKDSKPSNSDLNELKRILNKTFPDTKCNQVIYTNNQDKLFFGACVYPVLSDDEVKTIVMEDKPIRINEYILEIDSKLFDPLLGLTERELTAIIMHEIGHMTNTSAPIDELRNHIDFYMAKNNDYIRLMESVNYIYILKYGFADALVKLTSVFFYKNEEFRADVFAITCGYGPDLESALDKIYRKGLIVNRDVNDKLIVLSWALRLYKDVKMKRIAALRAIARAKSLSPSSIEKASLDTLSSRLKRIDDISLGECACMTEGFLTKAAFDLKMGGIKGFESDLYEYRMIITNIDEQDEAVLTMRQINARIAILQDMRLNKNASEHQKKEIDRLLDGFIDLREKLSKKVTYKDRSIGVVVNYPAIKGLDY